MNLEDYLQALKDCPDELREHTYDNGDTDSQWRLTTDYGVYDNFPILLHDDFESVLYFLEESDFRVVLRDIDNRLDCDYARVDYNSGLVSFEIWDSVCPGFTTPDFSSVDHNERQNQNYSITLYLHPYGVGGDVGCESSTRAMANVIDLIGNYALEKEISLCFPRSIGWNHKDDLSQIVYFP